MALRIHALEQMASRPPREPLPITGKTPSAPSATTAATTSTTSTGQSAQAPSFSAVFAQIAAAAAAAGTTVASTAPVAAASAQQGAATPTSTTSTSTTPASTSPSVTPEDDDDPAGSLFGPNPWLSDPTGANPDGSVTHYNPVYFATQQTAQTVAQMLGGTVTQSVQITTAPGSPFQQNQPNYMVQLPNGGQINPGFIADLYTHGWNQTFINQQIAAEVAGAQSAVNS